MIDFMQRLPGRIVELASAHPVLVAIIVPVLCGLGYIAVLKLYIALEDARDIRNRRL